MTKKERKNKKINSKNVKGFSLIETLVSMFIFSLMMTMLSGSFSNFLREFTLSKKEQRVLENAQYALSLIEKTMRTSIVYTTNGSGTLDFATSKKIKLFDYSQEKCLSYKFDNINKKIILLVKSGVSTPTTCGDFESGYIATDLTGDNIKNVAVEGWVSSVSNPGRVSIAVTLNVPGSSSDINVSTTASLRSF